MRNFTASDFKGGDESPLYPSLASAGTDLDDWKARTVVAPRVGIPHFITSSAGNSGGGNLITSLYEIRYTPYLYRWPQ